MSYQCSAHQATCDLNETGKEPCFPLLIKSDDTFEETAACLQHDIKKAMNYLLVQLVDMGEEWWGL